MALSSTEAERNVCTRQRQKAIGYSYISPRDHISHQALSRLPVANHIFLRSCTVHIGHGASKHEFSTPPEPQGILAKCPTGKANNEGNFHGSKFTGVKNPLQVFPNILCKTNNSLT